MTFKAFRVVAALVASMLLFHHCSKDRQAADDSPLNLPATPFNYNTVFPLHIAQALALQDNTPADNPITNDGATLGRVLFYDKNLSQNYTISCASCHKQELSFSDNGVKSTGFNGGSTFRHSMPTLNLRFYRSGRMFWDERAATLEEQVLMPIQDATEMGMTLSELVTRLSSVEYYPGLFQKAFGTTEITADRISKALAQFLRSIVTYQSKYDRVKQGLDVFTADEQAGEQHFLAVGPGACGGCHRPPMFTTSNPVAPFGLLDPNDQGINNENRFKSGTLRNIANTAPLFHNGSVPGLQAMLNSNIPAHGIAPQDRMRVLAFLNTLTDEAIRTDVRFSDPFNK
ncbi:MAG TPA: cytochrome c peroxidase [Flavisolibacter sp.]